MSIQQSLEIVTAWLKILGTQLSISVIPMVRIVLYEFKDNSSNALTLGTVTMWSPSMTTPLVKMLCHEGPVRAVACDGRGQYMATSGCDGRVKIWDLR